MNRQLTPRRLALAASLLSALWLAGCGSTGSVPGQLSGASGDVGSGPVPRASNAASARDYRRDAARHIYDANRSRIYKGQLPPVLYAVGTLEVNLDTGGKVRSMRAARGRNPRRRWRRSIGRAPTRWSRSRRARGPKEGRLRARGVGA